MSQARCRRKVHTNRNTVMPLPSLIRASGQDAGNASMRAAGRIKWNDDDWNAAAGTQERLIRSIYGRETDHNNEPNCCYIRFSFAEAMEKRGDFNLASDLDKVFAYIERCMAPEAEAA